MTTASDSRRVRILVRGRVQGVGFRYATVAEARRLGLAGWARNLPDGRVEILAEGAPDAVQALIEWCGHGPPSACVAGVHHEADEGVEVLRAFGVR
jgi:acylphosphatase